MKANYLVVLVRNDISHTFRDIDLSGSSSHRAVRACVHVWVSLSVCLKSIQECGDGYSTNGRHSPGEGLGAVEEAIEIAVAHREISLIGLTKIFAALSCTGCT